MRWNWPKRRRGDEDVQEEIHAHLALAADERIADGESAQSARRAALKDFGNVTLTADAVRSVWAPWWAHLLGDFRGDVRHALRSAAKNPGFSLTIVAVLTLGIVLNAAVFTLLKSLALTPLAGVDRSASLAVILNETSAGRRAGLSYPDYEYLRDNTRAFVSLIGVANQNVSVGLGMRSERIQAELVSGNYFQALGVSAQLGRTLLPSDNVAPGQHPVVVLSDTLWRRQFAADASVIGTTVHLNAQPLTVVGVAAPSFHGTIVSFEVEAFIPIVMAETLGRIAAKPGRTALSDRQIPFVIVSGHLRPGITLADASSEVAVLSAQLDATAPADAQPQTLAVVPIWNSPFGAQTYMLPSIAVLSAMGGLLLLIVCANLSGLVLARALSRSGEVALRLALGASRGRIVRLLLMESVVLALPGAMIALALLPFVVPMSLAAVASAAPTRLFFNVSPDWMVVAFSVLTALASALAFGLAPALRNAGVDLLTVMKEDLAPRGAARGRFRLGLVVMQVAVSVPILIGAGLVARSVAAARTGDMGFDATDVVSARLDLRPAGYSEAKGRTFYARLLDDMRADPAIGAATLAALPPLTLVDNGARPFAIDGYAPAREEDLTFLSNVVTTDYFRTLRIALVAGREFERHDGETALRVAMVNETLARRFWGDPAGAIGKRIRVSEQEWRRVVGVVRDIKYSRINETPRPYVYLPFEQMYSSMMVLHVRGTGGAEALLSRVRDHIQSLDAELPILAPQTLLEQTRASFAFLELAAGALFAFGLAGLALAALGLYAQVSYMVAQSAHEIGIRLVLGAARAGVVWHFLRRGLRLGAVGLIAGTIVALVVTRFLGSVLYGVSSTDAASYMAAAVVVCAVVTVATVVPAWRAARTSPLAALRRR